MKQHDIGIAGLAVMGENLVLNIASRGFSVSVYNRSYDKTELFLEGRARGKDISGFAALEDFVNSLKAPRRILLMVKAGAPVDQMIEQLLPLVEQGDIIIDGGNSHYADTERRTRYLEKRGLLYIGTGVSGGEEGALKGPSIMPGGSQEAWPHVKSVFLAAAARAGNDEPCCRWMGSGGAGHFVKMVHNGIEYGDMQLICEAYQFMNDVLDMGPAEIQTVFSKWNTGVLGSYLVEITADILDYRDEKGELVLDSILDAAGQKGTGKWTVNAALDLGVVLSLISESVFARGLSSYKELRTAASARITGPTFRFDGDREEMLRLLEHTLYTAKIISYAQGFDLLKAASEEFDWQLDFADIAEIWRGGCIIRSAFLDIIAAAFRDDPDLEHILFAPYFQKQINDNQQGYRTILTTAIQAGMPMPCHASGLAYLDGLRSNRLPANLLQAQRDYFGAHMYERIDTPRGEWFHTNWTGKGGATTSTAYTG